MNTIKLGCLSVPVVSSDLGSGLLGEYSGMPTPCIRVHSSLPEPQLSMVVFHEVLHALSDSYDLGLSEGCVRILEQSIAKMVQDNPEWVLRAWLALVGPREACKVLRRLDLV